MYHLTEDNKLFVHAGIDLDIPLEKQNRDTFLWDRYLINKAKFISEMNNDVKFGEFDEIYVGHTDTSSFSKEPIKYGNLWCMDQGGGWSGKLSIMDIDSKEFWQSDNVPSLYPDHRGR